MKKITLEKLHKLKLKNEPIAALTAYDALFAKVASDCGIELILVGDSLGVVVLGYPNTVFVSMEDMLHHTRAAARKNPSAFLMTDMPFQSYSSKEKALENAALLMQAGAEIVKMEGGEELVETVSYLTTRGIPVCGHLGLLPQFVQISGYKFDPTDERKMLADAISLQEAGAQMLILKCVHSNTASQVTKSLKIPVIGIGAGPHVDGQIQILQDLLGFHEKHSTLLSEDYFSERNRENVSYFRDFLSGQKEGIWAAFQNYVRAVKERTFPSKNEQFL